MEWGWLLLGGEGEPGAAARDGGECETGVIRERTRGGEDRALDPQGHLGGVHRHERLHEP